VLLSNQISELSSMPLSIPSSISPSPSVLFFYFKLLTL